MGNTAKVWSTNTLSKPTHYRGRQTALIRVPQVQCHGHLRCLTVKAVREVHFLVAKTSAVSFFRVALGFHLIEKRIREAFFQSFPLKEVSSQVRFFILSPLS